MSQKRDEVWTVFEAPLTNIEPVQFSTNKTLRVVRRIPCFEEYVAESDMLDAEVRRSQW